MVVVLFHFERSEDFIPCKNQGKTAKRNLDVKIIFKQNKNEKKEPVS